LGILAGVGQSPHIPPLNEGELWFAKIQRTSSLVAYHFGQAGKLRNSIRAHAKSAHALRWTWTGRAETFVLGKSPGPNSRDERAVIRLMAAFLCARRSSLRNTSHIVGFDAEAGYL